MFLSFGALGTLCFVIVAFPGNLHGIKLQEIPRKCQIHEVFQRHQKRTRSGTNDDKTNATTDT